MPGGGEEFVDSDGDGIYDEFDCAPADPTKGGDADNDGVGDCDDCAPGNSAYTGADFDGDGYNDCEDCNDLNANVNIDCSNGGCPDPSAEWECNNQWTWQWNSQLCRCECLESNGCFTPIILDLAGNNFSLTSKANGVQFDFGGDGIKEQVPWTSANSDDAWLALDRNGDGIINSSKELFGNGTQQPSGPEPNGFKALAALDSNGDGKINALDPTFTGLRLWVDSNHDGISQEAELFTLPAKGMTSIETAYKVVGRTDNFGNKFLFKGRALLGGKARNVYDVILAAQ